MLLLILLIIKISIFSLTNGYQSYLVRKNKIPTIFNHNFSNLNADFLTKKLTINISLSKFKGIMLYSIDRKENQLIVSMDDFESPTITFEYNRNQLMLTLNKFCGCENCKYKPLEINIVNNGVLKVTCNGQKNVEIVCNKKEINKDYPILPFDSYSDAYLWLVNIPKPYNDQLSGCIHDIIYEGKKINLTTNGEFHEDICIERCSKKQCNSGKCLETYSEQTFCNCTNVLGNGKYCNESISIESEITRKYSNKGFMLKILKISWNSNQSDICIIKNERYSILIYAAGKDLKLKFEENAENMRSVEGIIMNDYMRGSDVVLLLYFVKNHLKIMNPNNNFTTNIPMNYDLVNEIFNSVEIRGPLKFGMTFKYTLNEDKWNNDILLKSQGIQDTNNTESYKDFKIFTTQKPLNQKTVVDCFNINTTISIAILVIELLIIRSLRLFKKTANNRRSRRDNVQDSHLFEVLT